MATILERLPSGARVAVIRLRSLGDCVLTTPALELLKRSRPDLKVIVGYFSTLNRPSELT